MGLELCFGLLLGLVGKNGLTLGRLIDALSTPACAASAGFDAPTLREGALAELVLIDPEAVSDAAARLAPLEERQHPVLERRGSRPRARDHCRRTLGLRLRGGDGVNGKKKSTPGAGGRNGLRGPVLWRGGAKLTGEVVFNTAMTGYQEMLTDPSYHGQLVTLTAPHIGNTGINAEDDESGRVWAAALVVRDLSPGQQLARVARPRRLSGRARRPAHHRRRDARAGAPHPRPRRHARRALDRRPGPRAVLALAAPRAT